MVLITNFGISIALSLLSFGINTANAANTSDIHQIFPDLGTLPSQGDYTVAYIDPKTNQLVNDEVKGNSKRAAEKRGQSYDNDRLVSLLRGHNAYGFCRSYCPDEYATPKPITKTASVTKTATASKTTTICASGCLPTTTTLTVTGDPLPASTFTETSTITDTETSTIEADTVTDTVSTTETATSTESTTITVTTILSFGSSTSSSTYSSATPFAPRGLNYPSYLRGYTSNQIVAACKKLVPPPQPRTTTVTRAATVTTTKTRTITSLPATITAVETSTPPASTITASTNSTTTTTVFTTTTPITTTTTTISTTITTTTASTAITSVCPSATSGISGIAVSPPGRLRSGGNTLDQAACCTFCYTTVGCNGWAFLGPNFCFASFGSPPNSAPISSQCPNGLGTYVLGTGGPADLAGGAGPCAA
ncbi:uncharacterized protein K441DRAFT_693380 [Cenococcum geophilum 1.58]|uniref:uncharacterized protein n=1 Tax=Cenococcum geophilum 1.58 TaxID=794803 RepID=UPI00358FBCCB|nr:hypothetical protein K441DRAFT_693380 [Cenococcum geophilum 1.58]